MAWVQTFYSGYGIPPLPYEYLIRVDKKYNLKAEELAPLTDAGLTPYRGIKKLRDAGALGPDRVLAVIGIGSLGAYAVQYAKFLSAGATVVGFGRNDEKLAVAKEYGADHVINTKGNQSTTPVRNCWKATDHNEIDAAVDCVGAEATIQMGFGLLATAGTYCICRPDRYPDQHSPVSSSSRGSLRITDLFGATTTISAK